VFVAIRHKRGSIVVRSPPKSSILEVSRVATSFRMALAILFAGLVSTAYANDPLPKPKAEIDWAMLKANFTKEYPGVDFEAYPRKAVPDLFINNSPVAEVYYNNSLKYPVLASKQILYTAPNWNMPNCWPMPTVEGAQISNITFKGMPTCRVYRSNDCTGRRWRQESPKTHYGKNPNNPQDEDEDPVATYPHENPAATEKWVAQALREGQKDFSVACDAYDRANCAVGLDSFPYGSRDGPGERRSQSEYPWGDSFNMFEEHGASGSCVNWKAGLDTMVCMTIPPGHFLYGKANSFRMPSLDRSATCIMVDVPRCGAPDPAGNSTSATPRTRVMKGDVVDTRPGHQQPLMELYDGDEWVNRTQSVLCVGNDYRGPKKTDAELETMIQSGKVNLERAQAMGPEAGRQILLEWKMSESELKNANSTNGTTYKYGNSSSYRGYRPPIVDRSYTKKLVDAS
jgi:hypothetical protein